MALTQEQIENIQIEHGIVYVNYGETGAKKVAPTRGGGTLQVTGTIRDIEFDGRKGKTKGMQVVEEIDAVLRLAHLDASIDSIHLAIPYAKKVSDKLEIKSTSLGHISNEGETDAYLKNITMFAKVVGGGYKKITLYNAMNEGDFTFAAVPKGEGVTNLEIYAHWDATDAAKDLVVIEDVETIA